MAQGPHGSGEPETPLVRLRRPEADDRALLVPLWRDTRVMRYLGGPCDQATANARLERTYRHWEVRGFGLSVVEDEEGRVLGLAGLTQEHREGDATTGEVEVSYLLYPHGWGRGYAAAAVDLVVRQGFTGHDLDELVAVTQQANRRSRRLLQARGFRDTGPLQRDGVRHLRYVLTRTGWTSASGRPTWVPQATGGDPLLAGLPGKRRTGHAGS